MKLKLATLILAFTSTLVIASSSAPPAIAATICDSNASSATTCFLATNDFGSTYYGHAGDFYTCPLTYFGVKTNDGFDNISHIVFDGVGVNGKLTPGTSVKASIRVDQECIAWAGAYGFEIRLEGLKNAPIIGTKISESFTYLKKYSARIDSYCFIETCGYSQLTFEFDIPANYQRDLVSVKARVTSKNVFVNQLQTTEFPYGDVFSIGDRLSNPTLASIDGTISEVDGRMICFMTDASESGIAQFGITGFEFEIFDLLGKTEVLLDKGTWELGTPPNNYKNLKMTHGDSSSAVIKDVVFHTFHFSEEIKGHTYGCKFRAVTVLGKSPWSIDTLIASRTVVRGYVQALPNVKVLCLRLNKTYPGGVALSSKFKNIGPKISKMPKVLPSIYKANSNLDLDGDGIVCEK